MTATILSTALAVAVAIAPAAASAGDEPANEQTASREASLPEPSNPPTANLRTANPRTASRDPLPILDVPYVLQSEELCGGAAVAMVMRFWGATGIYAENFSSLVDKSARGIKGEDLIRSLHERGWQAVSFNGDRQLVERSLEQRRPPIALIEVRPGRFHYVVILSWGAGKVVVHDPARKPFDVRDEADFLRAWEAIRTMDAGRGPCDAGFPRGGGGSGRRSGAGADPWHVRANCGRCNRPCQSRRGGRRSPVARASHRAVPR